MEKNKKILITGASGFLGHYVVQALLDNNYTNILATSFSNVVHSKVPSIKLNLQDVVAVEQILENVDCVIHLAGLVSYNKSDKKNLLTLNQICTRDLINACLYKKVKNFIFCSSASTLSKTNNPYSINDLESGDSIFFSNYAHSKFLAELEVLRGEAEGLNISILHPSLIMGVGDWKKGSCVIFKQVFDGLSFFPSGSIGIVHASDVANAIVNIFDKNLWSSRFLLVAEQIKYQNLFLKIAKAFHVPEPRFELNQFLAKSLVYLDNMRAFLFNQQQIITKETIIQVFQNYVYNNSNSKDQLNLTYKLIDEYITNDCEQYLKLNFNNERKL